MRVAWSGNATLADARSAGLRFINIIQSDRQRLDRYVSDRLKAQGFDVNNFQARQELLDRMVF